MNTFSEVIKEIRIKNNLSQEQLAAKLKISRSAVSMWERGKREPDYDTLLTISDLFNIDIYYLLRQSPNTFKVERYEKIISRLETDKAFFNFIDLIYTIPADAMDYIYSIVESAIKMAYSEEKNVSESV